MSNCRLARLGVACVLFGASWAHAQASQAHTFPLRKSR